MKNIVIWWEVMDIACLSCLLIGLFYFEPYIIRHCGSQGCRCMGVYFIMVVIGCYDFRQFSPERIEGLGLEYVKNATPEDVKVFIIEDDCLSLFQSRGDGRFRFLHPFRSHFIEF